MLPFFQRVEPELGSVGVEVKFTEFCLGQVIGMSTLW